MELVNGAGPYLSPSPADPAEMDLASKGKCTAYITHHTNARVRTHTHTHARTRTDTEAQTRRDRHTLDDEELQSQCKLAFYCRLDGYLFWLFVLSF